MKKIVQKKVYEPNEEYFIVCTDQSHHENFAIGVARGKHIHYNESNYVEVYMDKYLFLMNDGTLEIMSKYKNDPKENEDSMWAVGARDITLLSKNYKRKCLVLLFKHFNIQ